VSCLLKKNIQNVIIQLSKMLEVNFYKFWHDRQLRTQSWSDRLTTTMHLQFLHTTVMCFLAVTQIRVHNIHVCLSKPYRYSGSRYITAPELQVKISHQTEVCEYVRTFVSCVVPSSLCRGLYDMSVATRIPPKEFYQVSKGFIVS
jgi:hypothetical protein